MPEPTIYPISDLRIRVEVQGLLGKDPDFEKTEIKVGVDHSEVRLGGVVLSPADAAQAVALVAAVEGVTLVRNDLLKPRRP